MARNTTKKHLPIRRKKSTRLFAFTAIAGLLLQMAWATAHYPMLLANLGTTENGVAVRTMVLCLHRAKEQRILKKLNQSRAAQTSTINQSPITRAADNEEAPLSDELCTFSIAIAGITIGNDTNEVALTIPLDTANAYFANLTEQNTTRHSYLANRGRSPPMV